MRIAISGLSGCGNTTASKNVGKALNLKIINYTFRDLAKDFGTTLEHVHEVAMDSQFKIDYYLEKKQIEMAVSQDNIILSSRLACWLIDADLKIWLYAGADERVRRIAAREGKPLNIVKRETGARDSENWLRYKKAYGIDLKKHKEVDIIINTENLSQEQVSALIVAAAKLGPMKGRVKMHSKIQKVLERVKDVSESEIRKLLSE